MNINSVVIRDENMNKLLSSRHFVLQLIIIFVLFTLGTALALGLPAALLLSRQRESQQRALINQANQTTLALFDEKVGQLQNFGLLVRERPTFNQLILRDQDSQGLSSYLEDLLANSGTDAIAVCRSDMLVSVAGKQATPSLCDVELFGAFTMVDDKVWILSKTTVSVQDSAETSVIVGQLAENVLEAFSLQSGLDYVLSREDKILVSNNLDLFDQIDDNLKPDLGTYQTITLNDNDNHLISYKTVIIPLPEPGPFRLIGLLNIEPYLEANRQLRNVILVTLLGVSLVGALVAVMISRRVSKPLNLLARSAVSLREGNLITPLANTSKIWEIDQLTNALEDARVSLKHSLDQLRKEKLWIENLLNSIVEVLLTVDEHGRITFASDAIERLLNVDLAHLLGRSLDDFFIPIPGEDIFSMQLPGLNQGRRIPVLINGKEVLLAMSESSFVPPEAGNATRALFIRDVTDEERIHRLIGEFLANITHEFRTPLSALSASVELLVDELPDLSTEEIGQLLHSLNIGIIDLQSLIDNLIEAASIEAGRFKVNPQEVELSSIIQRAIETVEPIAKKHSLSIIQPKEKQSFLVMADRRRTCQALINLLTNAIHYSPEGGVLSITTLILAKEVLVEVQDQGQGVSVDQQSRLFKRFTSSASDHDLNEIGLGLGLSVVKAIIEAQNGRVGYKDGETGGAIFWFTLPLADGGVT